MKIENKRINETGFYSPSKRQNTRSNPLAEQILNEGQLSAPQPLFPPISIDSCYSPKNKLLWISKTEFEEKMSAMPSVTFNDRWLSLHQVMALSPTSPRDTIYIDWDETTTFMIYQREDPEFHSEAIEETLLRDYPEVKNPYYRYIEIAEWVDGSEEPRVKITYSPLGTAAELCWIEKGVQIPGNKLFEIYEWMQEILKPRNIYLFDDAKLYFGKEKTPKELSLRYLKVFTAAIEPFNSWYEERGYALVESPQIAFNNGEERTLFAQSPQDYQLAKTYFRNLTLWDLSTNVLKHNLSGIEKIQRLFKNYVESPNPTLHELVKEIAIQAKKSKQTEHLHFSKINEVFSICMDEFEGSSCPPHYKSHQAQILSLRLSRLYVKKF